HARNPRHPTREARTAARVAGERAPPSPPVTPSPSPPHSELCRRPRLRASRRLLCYARGHEAANGEGAAMKVLVIDDEPEVRRVCGDILREEGWGVVEAADGPGGRAAARQERRGAVLLDGAMPGVGGF